MATLLRLPVNRKNVNTHGQAKASNTVTYTSSQEELQQSQQSSPWQK